MYSGGLAIIQNLFQFRLAGTAVGSGLEALSNRCHRIKVLYGNRFPDRFLPHHEAGANDATHIRGRIGRPAASADVQSAGRRAFEFKSQIAPEPPLHCPLSKLAS